MPKIHLRAQTAHRFSTVLHTWIHLRASTLLAHVAVPLPSRPCRHHHRRGRTSPAHALCQPSTSRSIPHHLGSSLFRILLSRLLHSSVPHKLFPLRHPQAVSLSTQVFCRSPACPFLPRRQQYAPLPLDTPYSLSIPFSMPWSPLLSLAELGLPLPLSTSLS